MAKTIVLVGTRKGAFLLESDEARRHWQVRGPFCESWPIYHAIYDSTTGTIYAAAASEWHGASVWRSTDLGETWQQSSEGLSYGDEKLKLSKVSGLTATDGRIFAGAENPGIFESRDGGAFRQSSSIPTGPTIGSRSCRASGSSRRRTTGRRSRPATVASEPTGRASTTTSGSAATRW
jgi:hypothetical protein